MIFYFTGTGNSLWVANELSKELREEMKNIIDIKDKLFVEDKVIGIVCPTYMGDLPWIVKDRLLRLKINPDTYTFAILTSNVGKSGKSNDSADKIFCTIGSGLCSFFDISMPGNCIISSKKQNSRRLSAAPLTVKNIISDIRNRIENYKSKGVKVEDNFVEDSFFYKNKSLLRLSPIKNFRINKDCDGCGLCQKICPINNITIKEKRAIHGNKCAACYACVHWCPKNATRVKIPILYSRFQYHHPDAKIDKGRISLERI
ncbi:MAG: 4Fe-4S dicluster domain-containing protein [Clostridiales bacterium]|nr:4Fe-4S dicluster domain-containing protein [Clostridiales bacterium]